MTNSHIAHQDGQYVVCGGSDQYWIGTAAKTLNAAKSIASKTYQAAVGGKLEVAIVRNEQYEVVAIKRGYNAWKQA